MTKKLIEGTTPISDSERAALLPQFLRSQGELDDWEAQNIRFAKLWVKERTDYTSFSFITELHKRMFDKTWRWAGSFRTGDKNIGIDWRYITPSLKNLCDNVAYQIEHHSYSLDEIAVRFHHRLVWIHPFPNGNGRHARLVADLLISLHGNQPFSWGALANLHKDSTERKKYIYALQCADRGDYKKLILFARS